MNYHVMLLFQHLILKVFPQSTQQPLKTSNFERRKKYKSFRDQGYISNVLDFKRYHTLPPTSKKRQNFTSKSKY